MQEELEQHRANSLALCEKLLNDLKRNQDDADSFLGGDIYKAYVSATEKAIEKARKSRNKIRNL